MWTRLAGCGLGVGLPCPKWAWPELGVGSVRERCGLGVLSCLARDRCGFVSVWAPCGLGVGMVFGVGMVWASVWAWCGLGVGLEWVRCVGCLVGLVWARCAIGVGFVWAGLVWTGLGCGFGVHLVLARRGLGMV